MAVHLFEQNPVTAVNLVRLQYIAKLYSFKSLKSSNIIKILIPVMYLILQVHCFPKTTILKKMDIDLTLSEQPSYFLPMKIIIMFPYFQDCLENISFLLGSYPDVFSSECI